MHEPKLFRLHRLEDASGVSGTGVVAEGACFSDGTAVLRWCTKTRSTAVYASMLDLLAIHGHGGATEVRYLLPEGVDDRACDACGHAHALHVHDGIGICDLASCACATGRPLGEPADVIGPDGPG